MIACSANDASAGSHENTATTFEETAGTSHCCHQWRHHCDISFCLPRNSRPWCYYSSRYVRFPQSLIGKTKACSEVQAFACNATRVYHKQSCSLLTKTKTHPHCTRSCAYHFMQMHYIKRHKRQTTRTRSSRSSRPICRALSTKLRAAPAYAPTNSTLSSPTPLPSKLPSFTKLPPSSSPLRILTIPPPRPVPCPPVPTSGASSAVPLRTLPFSCQTIRTL